MGLLTNPSGSKSRHYPNFLVVGAVKAATTSLYFWLKQHPAVYMAPEKEPSYFVSNYGYDSWNSYLDLFDNGVNESAIGEASADYLYCSESPKWILDKLG